MNTKQGIVGWILIIIAIIALLSFLNIDLRSIFDSEDFKNNMRFVFALISTIWDDYIKGPVTFIWQKILKPYVFEPLGELLRKEKEEKIDGSLFEGIRST